MAPNFLWLEFAIIPLTIVCFALKPLSYVLFVTLLTPRVILLIDLGGSGDWAVAALRVGNTVSAGRWPWARATCSGRRGSATACRGSSPPRCGPTGPISWG